MFENYTAAESFSKVLNLLTANTTGFEAEPRPIASKTPLFHKTTRFISKIPTLFRVPPQLFQGLTCYSINLL